MLEIKKLNYSYPDGKKALKDINIKIYDNETIGIVGANGAGKSTLIKTIVGIFLTDQGEIIVDGEKVTKKTLNSIRKKVGVVFQNPDDQLFMNKVYDDIAFGPRNYKLTEEKVKEKVEKVMKELNIEKLKDRSPNNLSGGEKRKVAIATVLSMEPSIILFDEPTSFLDPKGKRILIETLKGINTTKIIATHDLDMVKDNCKRVIVLKEGQVVADGKPKEILNNIEFMEKCELA
ncbi:MAG: energy-coupling factor ABC transporter ATP-binding protein [Clostridium sp.]|jgi:cobalt/nickel transport system ATP-binding protein|nr:ABC transporter ATP-binding protein [Clostridium sp.]